MDFNTLNDETLCNLRHYVNSCTESKGALLSLSSIPSRTDSRRKRMLSRSIDDEVSIADDSQQPREEHVERKRKKESVGEEPVDSFPILPTPPMKPVPILDAAPFDYSFLEIGPSTPILTPSYYDFPMYDIDSSDLLDLPSPLLSIGDNIHSLDDALMDNSLLPSQLSSDLFVNDTCDIPPILDLPVLIPVEDSFPQPQPNASTEVTVATPNKPTETIEPPKG